MDYRWVRERAKFGADCRCGGREKFEKFLIIHNKQFKKKKQCYYVVVTIIQKIAEV